MEKEPSLQCLHLYQKIEKEFENADQEVKECIGKSQQMEGK